MRFKVHPGPTFDRLMALQVRIKDCKSFTLEFMKQIGATGYRRREWSIAGGASHVFFADPPEGWKKTRSGFIPTDRETSKRMKELPFVHCSEINDIIGFARQGDCSHPNFAFKKGQFLFTMPDWVDFSNPEMEEITVRQYEEIYGND